MQDLHVLNLLLIELIVLVVEQHVVEIFYLMILNPIFLLNVFESIRYHHHHRRRHSYDDHHLIVDHRYPIDHHFHRYHNHDRNQEFV
jgi:hypothetical protein